MLINMMKNLLAPSTPKPSTDASPAAPLRLHIGGKTPHPDWKIIDTLPGPHVDYVFSCTDLSAFANESVSDIYASHVLEHLSYQAELSTALNEFHRVLKAGGTLRVSVPDLATLCSLYIDPQLSPAGRFHVMRMMFGGQMDSADFHRVGLDETILAAYLTSAGFSEITRVHDFALFDDTSVLEFAGRRISVNLVATKRAAAQPAA